MQKIYQPISDEILNNMANECFGVTQIVFEKSKEYTIQNAHEIRGAIFGTEFELIKNNPSIKEHMAKEDAETRSDLTEIIKYSKKLHGLLNELPDIGLTPAIYLSGLSLRIQGYMYGSEQVSETDWIDDSERKLLEWDLFKTSLEKHIQIFEEIEHAMKPIKRGRPKTMGALSVYIAHIALMYETVTERKFTVCEYGDEECLTEGMRYARESMKALYLSWNNEKETYEKHRYSKENFYNACAQARKSPILRKNKKYA